MLRRALIASCFVAAVACSAGGGEDPFSDGNGQSGTGGSGVIFGGTSGTNGASGTAGSGTIPGGLQQRIGDTNCYARVSQGEQVPLDLYIMWDQSLSMSCQTPSGSTRWDEVKQALSNFVQDPAASGIGVGIQYFGQGSVPFLSSCNVADYVNADVPIAPLPPNAQPIMDSLNRHGPGTNTPTTVALQGAVQHAQTWKGQNPGHTVAVILVTDGQPNACGDIPATVAAAQQAAASGIPVYVIGVISPGVDCGILDPNPPNQPDLDAVAVGGGTSQALMVDAGNNGAQQFLERMNQIRGEAQVPCEYQIPPPDPANPFNRDLVNVQFTIGGTPTIVYAVPDASACNPAQGGGWYFDNPADPKRLLLCPTTCNTVTTTVGIQVQVALGCQSIPPPA
jgi:hypothetical protein